MRRKGKCVSTEGKIIKTSCIFRFSEPLTVCTMERKIREQRNKNYLKKNEKKRSTRTYYLYVCKKNRPNKICVTIVMNALLAEENKNE